MKSRHCLWFTLLMANCSKGEVAMQPQIPAAAKIAKPEIRAEPEPSGPYAIKIDTEFVPLESFRFMHNGFPLIHGNMRLPPDQRKVIAMEFLIQRELLARAATKLNFSVSDKTVRESIEAGDLYFFGNRHDGKAYWKEDASGGTEFDLAYLEHLVKGVLGLNSVAVFEEEQRRELMAQFMRDMIAKSETVSVEEARKIYIADNSTVSADYVSFDALYYRSKVQLNTAMVQSYAKTHEEQLKAEWDRVKPRWQNDKSRIELSILKIERSTSVRNRAKKKIRRALAKIRKGADFGRVAAITSQDKTAGLGGYVGWRSAQTIGYGPEVVAACNGLAAGEVSEVIETPSAYYLVRIANRSDKGLRFAQMKFTLATKLAPLSIGREQAKKAAKDALASPLPLDKQFLVAKQPSIDIDSLPQEIREQLTSEQLKQLMQTEHLIAPSPDNGRPPLNHAGGIRQNDGYIAGLWGSQKLVKALSGDVVVGARMPIVYEFNDGNTFVIARLTKRTEADMEAFKHEVTELRNVLAQEKARKAVQTWVADACHGLLESNAIAPDPEFFVSDTLPYMPCEMLRD